MDRSLLWAKHRRRHVGALTLAWIAGTSTAHAEPSASRRPPAATTEEDSNVALARELFREGVLRVQEAKWAEGLAAFERSHQLRPHAVTSFNIGACERALGRYTRARRVLFEALAAEKAEPGQLAPSLIEEAHGFLNEIDALLGRVKLSVTPQGAILTIDGRPMEAVTRDGKGEYVAGTLPPGAGQVAPAGDFVILLDPGAHVFTLRRKGYADVVVNRDVKAGTSTSLALELDLLPATLSITANVPKALVKVNGEDLGPVPVSVLRPSGVHAVEVRRSGYEPYAAKITAQPGEQLDLSARLVVKEEPLTATWWFWTGAAIVVAGGAAATYALTRPDEPPPAYDGGSTGWIAQPGGVEF